jgi:hypothetical protein
MPVPLAVPLLAQLPKAGLGIWQMIKAGKIDDTRPLYDIPGTATAAKNLAATQAGQAYMPGYAETLGEIDRVTGNTIGTIQNTATSSGQALEAAVKASAGAAGAKANLGIANAGVVENRRDMYKSALDQYAGYQDKKWQWDKQQEFIERMGAKSALINAGIHNVSGALDGAGSTLMTKMMYDQYFPKDGSVPAPNEGGDSIVPKGTPQPGITHEFGHVSPGVPSTMTPQMTGISQSGVNNPMFTQLMQALQYMQGGGLNLPVQ